MGRLEHSASALLLLALMGCGSQRSSFAADPPSASTIAPPAVTTGTLSRSQKPDTTHSSSGPIRQTTFEAVSSGFPQIANGEVAVQIRAHVNGLAILDEEVRNACYPALIGTLNLPEPERSAQQAEILRSALDAIIDREVILQDAYERLSKTGKQYLEKLNAAADKEFDKLAHNMKKRVGCKTDEELKEFLRSQGQSLEGIHRQVKRDFMAREYMRNRIYPAIERIGHEQIQQYYNEHLSDFQAVDSVQWQDIFVDASRYPSRDEARQVAEQLVRRARAGEDFSALRKFDNGDSSYRNGEGIGQHHGEIQPAQAEPILFQLKAGEVGPIVELPTGFHLIRLVKREYAGLMPLDEKLQVQVRRKLQSQVADREMKRFVAELKQKAVIEIAAPVPQ